MSNQNNQPQPDDFINFLQHMFGTQEQAQDQDQEVEGFAIHTDFGDTLIEVIDHQVQVSVNGTKVMGLDFDQLNQTITVKAFDYQSLSNDYEQVIRLGSDENDYVTHYYDYDIRYFIQRLQDDKMIVTLDTAINPNQDVYILAKKLDNSSDKDSFQIWHIPSKGPDGQPAYNEALCVGTKSTLDDGSQLFRWICRKAFAE